MRVEMAQGCIKSGKDRGGGGGKPEPTGGGAGGGRGGGGGGGGGGVSSELRVVVQQSQFQTLNYWKHYSNTINLTQG